MKKIIFTVLLNAVVFCSFAQQQQMLLTVRWNTSTNQYEVYGTPNFTDNKPNLGTSQITILTPATAPDSPLVPTGAGLYMGWGDEEQVYAPAADPIHDFHAFLSIGNPPSITSGVEMFLFSFVFDDGLCRDGLRLFINGSDPNDSAPGMYGANLINIFNIGIIKDVYSGNYNNTGTTCNACNITAPTFDK